MLPADAYQAIRRMVQADQEPALADPDIQALVAYARRADVFGLAPSDPAWTPTYDLNAAAAEGWRWKAGSAAGQFDFKTNLQTFTASQTQAMCLSQAKAYAARVGASPSMPGETATTAGGVPWIQRPLP